MANFNPLGYTGRVPASTLRLGVAQFNPQDFSVDENGVVSLGGTGAVQTINSLLPTAGNIVIAGTANKVSVSNAGSTVTLSLPAAVTVTTSVTTASFITSSATLGVTYTDNSITPTGSDANISLLINGKGTGGVIQSRGLVGSDLTIENTNTDNTNGASRAGFEVAVGGASAGDPYINFLVSGAGVFTMGIDNSASDNFVISASAALGTSDVLSLTSAGALTTAAGITATTGNIVATAGDISATLGNVIIAGAAKQLQIEGGAVTDFIGQATLINGTVSIANTNIAAGDKVLVSRQGINGSTALGVFDVVITPATSFSITARNPTDATTQTNDISIVDYVIIRQL